MKTIINRILLVILIFTTDMATGFAQQPLSLEQAITISLENNYDLSIAGKRVETAKISNTWGAAGALPIISFNGSVSESINYNDTEDYSNTNVAGDISMNWVLFDGFSVKINKQRLEELQMQSEGNAVVVIESTIQDVILSYFKCLMEKEKEAMMLSLMELSNDRYSIVKEMKDLGVNTTYDLLQAQNSYLEDKSTYLLQKLSYENECKNLNYLLGVDGASEWELTTPFEKDTLSYEFAVLQDKMLSNNATLKNQYIYQSLLEKEIKLAKSSYYPTLSLNAGINANDNTTYYYENTPDRSADSYSPSGSLVLSYSIFNGGNRKRALDIAKVNSEIGDTQTDQMEHSLSNQLYQLYNFYSIRKELLTLSEEQQQAAQLNLNISAEKFAQGAINSFNYRDVQILYKNASLGYLDAIYNLIESDTQLLKITGGILDEYK